MSNVLTRTHDPIWHLQLGVIVIIALQLVTAPAFLPYNKFILIALEVILMVALVAVTPRAYDRESRPRRTLAIGLLAVITFVNTFSLLYLIETLVNGTLAVSGRDLLLNGAAIYITNIFIFAIMYWELDGDGPDRRAARSTHHDFMFTQMAQPKFAPKGWLPGFSDYLYLSATNTTNFASAETTPLTHRAKTLMMVQSIISMATVILIVARAISTLG